MQKKVFTVFITLIVFFISTPMVVAGDNNNSLKKYDVTFYHLDIELYNNNTYISGNTLIQFCMKTDSTSELELELSNDLTVDSVLLNGLNAQYKHKHDTIFCTPDWHFRVDTTYNIKVFYHGTVTQEGFFSGLSTGFNSETFTSATWTLSEPFSAKDWFACKQELSDKADSVYVYITTSSFLRAGANGVLVNEVKLPGNKTRYEWKSRYPTAFYLISAVVSDYMDYSFYAHPKGATDSVLIQNYIYNNHDYLANNKEKIDVTAELLELFSELFGLYPFAEEKYGHCVVPMQGGGMEHQTMTTILHFNFSLIAHELAHAWFGNSVTCASWQDIWVNEGFASYCEYLAYEYVKSPELAMVWMLNTQSRALESPTGSIYIPQDKTNDTWRIFDISLSYKKGAAVIHMIRFELNNDLLFFDVLREYLIKYQYANAGIKDFQLVLEEVSGKDFDYFFDQWIYGEGYPIYDFQWLQQNDTITIISNQTTSSFNTPFFESDIEFKVSGLDYDTLFRVRQTQNIDTFMLSCDHLISVVKFDPHSWLLKKAEPISRKAIYVPNNKLFKVHPNPFNENITLHFKTEDINYDLRITDIEGKIVFEKKIVDNHRSLYTKNWANGIYLVNVLDHDKIYSEKVLKE